MKEHEDGSATVTFETTEKEREFLIEFGLTTLIKKSIKKYYPAPHAQNYHSSEEYIMDYQYE